jgi:AcrR family transcriptional regulator
MRTVNPVQHARRRARILEAAAVEFAEAGVDGTSTARICRRAGIGSGTLFHYFRTKRAIFHALFADAMAHNEDVRADALADDDPAAGLDLLLTHLLADFADPATPGLAAAAMLQANRDVEFAALLGTDDERTHEALTTLLTRLSGTGPALAFGPDRTAWWIQRTIDATYLVAGDPGFDPDTTTAEIRRVIGWLIGRDLGGGRSDSAS